MSNSLSSDLASLKIDREAQPRPGGPLRVVLIVLVVLGLAVAGYVIGKPYLEAQVFKTTVDVSEISLVSPAQASIELSSSGYVVPQVRSLVGARIPGRVIKLYVKEGERVKAGQVLIELERADQVAAIQASRLRAAAARARVVSAGAGMNELKRQEERTRALVAHGAAAQATLDDLESRVQSLREQVKASEAEAAATEGEIEVLRLNLGHMTLVAPITGTVLNKPPEVGEVLGNDFGLGTTSTGTIELADFSTLVVETDVPEGRLNLIRIGSPCEIVLDAYPERRYRGTAIEIMPRVNRAKATVGVKVKFEDAADGALPDMAARVSFLAKALEAAQMKEKPKLVVPSAALAERGGEKVVFVIDGDEVHMKPVTLGAAFGEGYELQSGPAAGTKVVKSPPDVLQDGNKIKERNAP